MLRLEALEVIQRFRKPGGADFALFCNKIIGASCWASGVPQSEVWTTSRTDAKDKGVDTRIGVALPNNKSGYFEAPTIWQFKAADESNVGPADIRKEVNKERSKLWISEGSAYRICLCDHVTPDKKQTLMEALEQAVVEINPKAPPPKILSIDDIVGTANAFPALVLEYRPGVEGMFVLFDRWKEQETGITPVFVPSEGFEATRAAILANMDLGNEVRSSAITLYGAPGAGKTRLAFECLKDIPAASSLVMYTTSEDDALDLANVLVNDQTAYAILVADECSIETRERLSRTLMNFRQRIRCLCIDNSDQRVATAAPELTVRKLNPTELEKVLAANFKEIPHDRLRAYAQYCDGSVRLAADMCAHFDAEIAQARNFLPVRGVIHEYYLRRLKDDVHREAIEAIALLKRVRHKGEVPTELELVCELTGTAPQNIERALFQIKEGPGWVEKGALYYRVTPDLIAWTALDCAWSRWAKGDEEAFMNKIPPAIQGSFLQRVSENGSAEVRETVQRFFRKFADDFTPRHLAEVELVNRFVSLIETDAALFLPTLRRVVEAATHDELTAGPNWVGHSWGPRRQLVWTAERFALFTEHFSDCEAILFALAKHECEPTIGNNATKIWQQLFRLQLSGTALPFIERLAVLRDRLADATEADAELLSGALGEILDFMGVRMLGPPVVGGRVPPADWHPANLEEMRASVKAGLKLLDDSTQHHLAGIAEGAGKALVGDLVSLARHGWIDELQPFASESRLSESNKATLATQLKNILAWGKHPNGAGITPEYETKLRGWITELEPKSLHARLVGVVGSDAFNHYGREKEWQQDLDQLAAELLLDEKAFQAEIEWLTSSEANGAFELGSRLGTLDTSATLLDGIIQKSLKRKIAFVRGYVAGFLHRPGSNPDVVNSRLDELEKETPLLSFQIALAGGSRVGVFDRAVRLIKEGQIPPYNLRNFTFWAGEVHTTNEQVVEALRILIPVASDDTLICDVIVDFLGARLHSGQLDKLIESHRELVWEGIAIATQNPGRETWWLARILGAAAPTNQPLAIRLACRALVDSKYDFKIEAENLLSNWASSYPREVMDEIGALMLDEKDGWQFFASKFRVFDAIPPEVVIHWLESAGVPGARKIARHLPAPHVDASGAEVIPKVTEFVLSRFEDDDVTFREFCAGTHSFQIYMGDVAAQKEAEAASVRPFFNHRLRRIREWARYEYDSGVRQATWHRELNDELGM
ncbi:MAG: hypothetical protein ABR973_12425 [Candidatus Acidiferrales bacterium]|jgi:hypothetical protein